MKEADRCLPTIVVVFNSQTDGWSRRLADLLCRCDQSAVEDWWWL